jgi:NAD(P)-dependent dehydrogenase (short-subunit alcohol dehydrogenase family)
MKRALVTGSSSGIGEAIAKTLASEIEDGRIAGGQFYENTELARL